MSFPKWSDRLGKDDAIKIRDNGEFVGDSEAEKGCYWRGYRLDGKCYIGLCDDLDIWEADEQTMKDHCA